MRERKKTQQTDQQTERKKNQQQIDEWNSLKPRADLGYTNPLRAKGGRKTFAVRIIN